MERDKKKKAAWAKIWYQNHKSETIQRATAFQKANPQKNRVYQRKSRLKREYNLSLEQYEALYVLQNGVCKICKQTEKDPSRLLSVDHCHKSLVIRGLLCTGCNLGLGIYEAMKEKFEEYLNESS
jgi:hypothetical protein